MVTDRQSFLEGITRGAAVDDARTFVDEYNEALDPAATDWDATAWGEVRLTLLAYDVTSDELDALWPIYRARLVEETQRLIGE